MSSSLERKISALTNVFATESQCPAPTWARWKCNFSKLVGGGLLMNRAQDRILEESLAPSKVRLQHVDSNVLWMTRTERDDDQHDINSTSKPDDHLGSFASIPTPVSHAESFIPLFFASLSTPMSVNKNLLGLLFR